MILYFANRKMEILGLASTSMQKGFVITEDLKVEEIDSGVASFSCRIGYTRDNRRKLEEMTQAGNYILRSNGGENEFYTILEAEGDTKNKDIYIYAEDAGLDLINEIVGEFEASEAHNAEWYVNKYIADSGFEIGINEIPSSTVRTLSWEGESTVTERLASIANSFGGFEVSYSFEVKGLEVTHKYINIYQERGKDVEEELRLDREIDRILTKTSVANLATALRVKGGVPDGGEEEVTLDGYQYDDGDFYLDGTVLKSRNALAKWGRFISRGNTVNEGHIERQYTYDTTSQSELCNRALTELKKVCEPETNYEIDINSLPSNIKIGDRINIFDDAGELCLSSRILILETSVVDGQHKATLGEYLIKGSGINDKVAEVADKLAQMQTSNKTLARFG